MNLNRWTLSAWVIAFALTAVIVRAHRWSQPDFARVTAPPARLEILTALGLIAIGLFLRFAFLDEFLGGELTGDEALTPIYTSAVVHGEPVRDGATHITLALAFDFWYRMFGFSALAARALTATMGAVGLVFLFLGLRRAAGLRLALWSTAFLSVSLYGIYFSKLAFDVGWALFLPPLIFFLAISAHQKRSALLAVAAGFVFSLNLFTYPGFMLATFSVVTGMTISYLACWRSVEKSWWRSSHWWGLALAFVVGSIPYTIFVLHAHYTILGVGGEALLRGGGGLSFSMASFLSGWYEVLYDALISSRSWYLSFREMSFFEISLLPLSVYGIFMFWRVGLNADTGKRWMWYGFFIAIPISIAIVPITGVYPGMRRAVFSLLPYSVALGWGLICLLSAITAQRSGTAAAQPGKWSSLLYRVLGLSVLILAVSHSIAYQFTTGRDRSRITLGEGFAKPRISNSFMLETLKTHDIVLDRDEFSVDWFDGLIYKHYARLYQRYNPELDIPHEVLLVPHNELENFANKILMTWDLKKLEHFASMGKVCISPEALSSKAPNLPYWGTLTAGRGGCLGSSGQVDLSVPGPVMDMRYDKLNRSIHQLQCNYCGPDRTTFIYTHGGDVTFLLTPPVSRDSVVLQFEIMNPSVERESLIYVNDVLVGSLTVAVLDETKSFADFEIPANARTSSDNWTIRIGAPADPKKLGWDISRVRLYTK